jgi:hypothetical protein
MYLQQQQQQQCQTRTAGALHLGTVLHVMHIKPAVAPAVLVSKLLQYM